MRRFTLLYLLLAAAQVGAMMMENLVDIDWADVRVSDFDFDQQLLCEHALLHAPAFAALLAACRIWCTVVPASSCHHSHMQRCSMPC
jgi:hypothetical protein